MDSISLSYESEQVETFKEMTTLMATAYRQSLSNGKKSIRVMYILKVIGHLLFLSLCALIIVGYIYSVNIKEYSPYLLLSIMVIFFSFGVIPDCAIISSNKMNQIVRYASGVEEMKHLHAVVSTENYNHIYKHFIHVINHNPPMKNCLFHKKLHGGDEHNKQLLFELFMNVMVEV